MLREGLSPLVPAGNCLFDATQHNLRARLANPSRTETATVGHSGLPQRCAAQYSHGPATAAAVQRFGALSSAQRSKRLLLRRVVPLRTVWTRVSEFPCAHALSNCVDCCLGEFPNCVDIGLCFFPVLREVLALWLAIRILNGFLA